MSPECGLMKSIANGIRLITATVDGAYCSRRDHETWVTIKTAVPSEGHGGRKLANSERSVIGCMSA